MRISDWSSDVCSSDLAGWDAAREGHALGFACYTEERWLCRVAAVIDTSLVDGQPKVNRIVVAVDHGFSVNPDSVIAQIQGAALFALPAALQGALGRASCREGWCQHA